MSVNFNANQNQNKGSYKNDLKGAALGLTSAIGTVAVLAPVGSVLYSKARKDLYTPSLSEQFDILKAGDKVIKSHNLDKFGLKIIYENDEVLADRLKKVKAIKTGSIKEFKSKVFKIKMAKPGGSYHNSKNLISLRGKTRILSVFHEIGHGVIAKQGKISRTIWQLKKCKKVALPIAIASLLIPTQRKNMNDNKNTKFTDWVKKNIGAVIMLLSAPVLINEAHASIIGCKDAKKVLNEKLYKNCVKSTKLGFASYLATAIILATTAQIANNVQRSYSKTHSKK